MDTGWLPESLRVLITMIRGSRTRSQGQTSCRTSVAGIPTTIGHSNDPICPGVINHHVGCPCCFRNLAFLYLKNQEKGYFYQLPIHYQGLIYLVGGTSLLDSWLQESLKKYLVYSASKRGNAICHLSRLIQSRINGGIKQGFRDERQNKGGSKIYYINNFLIHVSISTQSSLFFFTYFLRWILICVHQLSLWKWVYIFYLFVVILVLISNYRICPVLYNCFKFQVRLSIISNY